MLAVRICAFCGVMLVRGTTERGGSAEQQAIPFRTPLRPTAVVGAGNLNGCFRQARSFRD